MITGISYQFKIVGVEPDHLQTFKVDTLHTTLSQTEAAISDKWLWPETNTYLYYANYVIISVAIQLTKFFII
jgi:hypothetical protein